MRGEGGIPSEGRLVGELGKYTMALTIIYSDWVPIRSGQCVHQSFVSQ